MAVPAGVTRCNPAKSCPELYESVYSEGHYEYVNKLHTVPHDREYRSATHNNVDFYSEHPQVVPYTDRYP